MPCSAASIAASCWASPASSAGSIATSSTESSTCSRPGRSARGPDCGASRAASPRTTSTGWPSASSPSSSGSSSFDDLSRALRHHVVAVRGRAPHHVHSPTLAPGRASDRGRDHGHLHAALPLDLRALRARGGRIPVLREGPPCPAPRDLLRGGRRRHVAAHGPPDVDHHLLRRLRVLDGDHAEPGVLRAPPRPGHRRLRRLRLPRPVRLLPLLRAGRAPHVPAHRHLGLLGASAAARDLRLGLPGDRRGDQGIRGHEADPLPAVRVGVHPGRDLRPLRASGGGLLLVPRAGGDRLRSDRPALGLLRLLHRLRDPGRHLASAHVVARRPRLGADGGVHAARRGAHEAGRLRGGATGDGTLAGGGHRPRLADRPGRVHQRGVRRAVGHGPGRPQVRDRVLLRVAHGPRHARSRHPERGWAQRGRVPDVRARHHDRALLRAGRSRLREGALPRDLSHGWLWPGHARHRHRVHHRRPLLAGTAGHRRLRGRAPHVHGGLEVGAWLVALSRRARHPVDRRVRAARGQADLLGSAVAAFPPSRGRAGTGVGGPGHPGGRPGRLRHGAGHRAGPGGHHDRPLAGEDPQAVSATLAPFTIEIGLAGLLLLVFVVTLASRGGDRRAVGWIATLGVLVLLGLAMALPPAGPALSGMFVQDGLAVFSKRLFLAATFIGLLAGMSVSEGPFRRRAGEYHLLILSSLLGMLVLASARDLILLFVAFELMSIPLYVLSGFLKSQEESVEAALKFFLVGSVSSAVMAYGLSFVYGATRSTDLGRVAQTFSAGQPLLLLGLLAVFAGSAFKIAAFPFHMWVPDTYEAASTPFVAWLSVAPKAAGFMVIFRLYLEDVGDRVLLWVPLAAGLATITIVAGNLMAIPQQNVQRLLAYSGIAHIGYMLVGFAAVSADGVAMMLFYLVAYLFGNMGAFLVVEAVAQADGSESIAAYRGLAQRSPVLALSMLLFLLSLGGIPFVAGFWAKLYVFWAAAEQGLYWLVLVGAILTVVALFYYLLVAKRMYIDAPATAAPVRSPFLLNLSIFICVAGVVGFGLYPKPLVMAALRAASSLF